jgi:TonB family protein
MEAVTELLVQRTRGAAGLNRMVAVSLGVHALLALAVLVMPSGGFEDRSPKAVMTISLGGPPGPRTGLTTMGGRPIQAPPAEAPTRTPVTAPAPKMPQMTVPEPKARPAPKTPVQNPWDTKEARSTTPVRAPQLKPTPGSTVAETGARGAGFGLSAGGGGTSGYLDVGNFCCPEYLTNMLQLIQRNWNSNQAVGSQTLMKFTIQRDGRLTDVQVEQSSGYQALDLASQRALAVTRQVPPLPAQYTENDHLTIHLYFRYQR